MSSTLEMVAGMPSRPSRTYSGRMPSSILAPVATSTAPGQRRSSASPSRAVAALDADRQHVHARRADEIADESVLRPLEQLGGRADLHDLALIHDHDLVGEGQRLGLVVRDIDHGVAEPAVQLLQLRAQHPFHVRIDDRQRLVEQDRVDVGAHQPAAERDLLLLVGGQARAPCGRTSRRGRSSPAFRAPCGRPPARARRDCAAERPDCRRPSSCRR